MNPILYSIISIHWPFLDFMKSPAKKNLFRYCWKEEPQKVVYIDTCSQGYTYQRGKQYSYNIMIGQSPFL